MTNRTRILTGITTTGTPHLGNYAGAIRPAILASRDSNADSFYFLADYHALIKCDDPLRIQRSRLEIAATWLAGGLDVDRVTFYRQSDIPEIPELTWLLTCVAAKGLLNRAHAYKASVDKNVESGEDPDAGIRVFTALDVLVHRGLVGVRTVEQALGGDAGQQPGQLGNFRNVGLAIEGHTVDIQATGQPGRGDFQTRALDAQRVIAFDQGVVVGQEIERIGIAVAAGEDRRADGAGVVAQVRRAGGGDAGEDTGTVRHG